MTGMQIIFSANQAAAALWTYAEDSLVERAEILTDGDLRQVWRIASGNWRDEHGLPIEGRLVLDKVTALACVTFLEGRVRPLSQNRRRPRNAMPERLRNAQPVPPNVDPR